MDSFEYARNITRTAMAAMAAMPRHEMGGNNFPEPVQFFFETPENVPPFFDSDHPFFDTDNDQVPENVPPFFDSNHHFFDTDNDQVPENVPPFCDTDNDQVADNLNIPTIFKYADDYVLLNVNENNLNYFLILIVALWYLTTSN